MPCFIYGLWELLSLMNGCGERLEFTIDINGVVAWVMSPEVGVTTRKMGIYCSGNTLNPFIF